MSMDACTTRNAMNLASEKEAWQENRRKERSGAERRGEEY
jgi:hypothetical protein